MPECPGQVSQMKRPDVERSVQDTTFRLYSAFHSGGLRRFAEEYDILRSQSLSYRLAAAVLESVVPLHQLTRVGMDFEQLIGERGIAAASRAMLQRWDLNIRYELSGEVWQTLDNRAFIAYGNHTSGLESILFDSLFSRNDVFQIGASFLTNIGPNISRTALLVERSQGSPDATPNGSRRSHLLASIADFIWPAVPRDEAACVNQRALATACDLVVRRRGGVNIFPTGSVATDAAWQNGVGSLVRRALTHPEADLDQVYLVPMVYGVPETLPLSLRISRRVTVIRLLARIQNSVFVPTPYVYALKSITLRESRLNPESGSAEITQQLREMWMEVHRAARGRFRKWPRQ